MSIKATIEIILQIESFRNIDLFHFGLYCLRGRFYMLDSSKKNVKKEIIIDININEKYRKYTFRFPIHFQV